MQNSLFPFFVSAENNQIRPSSSWGFHSFGGFLGPNIPPPPHAPPEAPVNLTALSALPQSALPVPKASPISMQNNGNLPVLSHAYPDSRYSNVGQFPFRTTSYAAVSTGAVTTTAAPSNLGISINPMGVCPPAPLDPIGHPMLSTSCQQMNASVNNSLINNSGINNGLTNGLSFRHQPYVTQTVAPKVNMPITQTSSAAMLGPITQPNATSGMSFPVARPAVMMGQGGPMVPSRIPMAMGNADSTYLNSVHPHGGYPLQRSDNHHGIVNLNLKQEPVDTHNHLSTHVGHGGLDVTHNGGNEDAMSERNGTTTPKGVWRPY